MFDVECLIHIIDVYDVLHYSHKLSLSFTLLHYYCICQIRQFRRLDDGSLNVVTRGKQRFRLRRRWIDVDGAVRIFLLK